MRDFTWREEQILEAMLNREYGRWIHAVENLYICPIPGGWLFSESPREEHTPCFVPRTEEAHIKLNRYEIQRRQRG